MTTTERGSIYLDGLDCSGKSSVGRDVARNLNISQVDELFLHPTTNPWNAEHTKEVDTDHPLFPAYLFRAAIWDIIHFNPKLTKVQVSFAVMRSTAYQLATEKPVEPVFEELLKYSPRFKHPFVLHASIEARQERLQKRIRENGERSVSKNDSLVFTKPDFVEKMGEVIIEKSAIMGAKIIDTTNMSQPEVVSVVQTGIVEGKFDSSFVMTTIPGIKLQDATSIFADLPALHKELTCHAKHVAKKHALPDDMLTRITMPFETKTEKL